MSTRHRQMSLRAHFSPCNYLAGMHQEILLSIGTFEASFDQMSSDTGYSCFVGSRMRRNARSVKILSNDGLNNFGMGVQEVHHKLWPKNSVIHWSIPKSIICLSSFKRSSSYSIIIEIDEMVWRPAQLSVVDSIDTELMITGKEASAQIVYGSLKLPRTKLEMEFFYSKYYELKGFVAMKFNVVSESMGSFAYLLNLKIKHFFDKVSSRKARLCAEFLTTCAKMRKVHQVMLHTCLLLERFLSCGFHSLDLRPSCRSPGLRD